MTTDQEKLSTNKPWRPGDGTPGPGRKKGVPNKATTEFRETITRVLSDNSENVGRWLTLVAEGDGTDNGKPDPAKALDLMAKLAEYAAPKLSRAEVTGADGGPVKIDTNGELDVRISELNARLAAMGND